MIFTVTLNPSLDSIYFTDSFVLGAMNRCGNPVKAIGGKGINAGRTAALLGAEVTAIGVLAGINGTLIRSALEQEPFSATHFLTVAGESRNAVTVMDQKQRQTEIVESGPKVSSDTAQQIIELVIKLSDEQKKAPILAFCGSVHSDNDYLYQQYFKQLDPRLKVLADISGQQLRHVLESSAKPYFIKPNIHEFAELLNLPIQNKTDVLAQLNHSLLKDIPFILVSCGSAGAVAKYNDQLFEVVIPQISAVNPTGSGDATVGGIAFALDQGLSIEETLQYAMACGMSNALEKAVGYITLETVHHLKEQIIVRKVFI
ncbi:hexose kinase [Erwinia sp. CPCC 100877]|nr:hexose kinase [Erwinia sp. CPCC 100877]